MGEIEGDAVPESFVFPQVDSDNIVHGVVDAQPVAAARHPVVHDQIENYAFAVLRISVPQTFAAFLEEVVDYRT